MTYLSSSRVAWAIGQIWTKIRWQIGKSLQTKISSPLLSLGCCKIQYLGIVSLRKKLGFEAVISWITCHLVFASLLPSSTLVPESGSASVVSDSLQLDGLYSPWNSPGQSARMGTCSLLQGIFPTQGSNPGLPRCRQILYHLSHKGSPRLLKWVAYLFSSGSSRPRNQTGVSCVAGGFFANWAMRGAPMMERTLVPTSLQLQPPRKR